MATLNTNHRKEHIGNSLSLFIAPPQVNGDHRHPGVVLAEGKITTELEGCRSLVVTLVGESKNHLFTLTFEVTQYIIQI